MASTHKKTRYLVDNFKDLGHCVVFLDEITMVANAIEYQHARLVAMMSRMPRTVDVVRVDQLPISSGNADRRGEAFQHGAVIWVRVARAGHVEDEH